MANKVVNYKKFRTDIINGKKRCIYMKPKGKREYVKSKGEFVLLSVYIKKMQKKMKIKGGGDKSFVGPTRPSRSSRNVPKQPFNFPPDYGNEVVNEGTYVLSGRTHGDKDWTYRRPLSNTAYNNVRHTTVTSRAYMEGLTGKKKPTLLEVDESKLEFTKFPDFDIRVQPGSHGLTYKHYKGKSKAWQKEHRLDYYKEHAKKVENENRIKAFIRGQEARRKIKSSLFHISKKTTQNQYGVSADLVYDNRPLPPIEKEKLTVGHA